MHASRQGYPQVPLVTAACVHTGLVVFMFCFQPGCTCMYAYRHAVCMALRGYHRSAGDDMYEKESLSVHAHFNPTYSNTRTKLLQNIVYVIPKHAPVLSDCVCWRSVLLSKCM
jgi:hypothetical protein